MQPISSLCSLSSNRASLQPLNRPAALGMDPIGRRESVCRSLFGPVDHDQLRRELKLRLKEITEQDSHRWNFNFQTETPLSGRFQWEEVPANCAASFYQEVTPPRDDVCTSSTEDGDTLGSREDSSGADRENCSRISNTLSKCPAEVTPVRRKRTLYNETIMSKRRTTTESKSIPNHFHTSATETALCKTIR
uniref:Cyclin-dependent kinase inhibitor domain-containing protein n=1 Tax=Anabas testudineus TaxID=64144 RepID=A0A3Q1J6V4_ANATE